MSEWEQVRDRTEQYTDRVLNGLTERWGDHERRASFTYESPGHDPDEPPTSFERQVAIVGGIVSVVVWYTDERRETVLVYNPAGGWEPPGGRIEPGQTPEEMARTEAREETGLDIELTDLCYTIRFEYEYDSGHTVELPLAQFTGRRTDGHLQVEREGNTHPEVSRAHPGLSRATGLFDAETLPEMRRERELIVDRMADPPEFDETESWRETPSES
ncbi:MAG: NUDIX domain-containing protein [Halobaculum sp.]